MNLSNYFKRK